MQPDTSILQRALDEDEFFPVFQPVVELRTGQLTGFELLARWRNGKRQPTLPEDFIPQIEAGGLSRRLTEKLLQQACRCTVLAQSSLRLSINLSPVQLQDAELPELIASCMEGGGFALDRLTLEITESALLKDLSRAQEVVRELKALGCELALDDFGTGYSSLRHLESLPFDKLKVDRSFVRSMTEARESRKIVAAVVGLGQSLGMTTIAEGVETQSQASMLVWLGCDLGQGWLYGRPEAAQEIPRLLGAAPQALVSPLPPVAEEILMTGVESLPAQRLAQIQAIYDGAPVGLCFLDRRMRYVSLNRRLADMNGAPVIEHLGKTVGEAIPHLFPLVEPYIRRALGGEPVMGVEVQKPVPEGGGEPQTLLLSYQPARDEAGEVLGVSVAIMDVTAQKRTEEALRESLSHFRHLLELGPHIPWVLNEKGEVVEASPRWEMLTGQRMTDAMGSGWQKMVHAEDLPLIQGAIRNSLTAGQPIDVYYRILGKDGSWMPMRTRGSPRFGSSGKIVGIYGVLEQVPESRSGEPQGRAG